MGKSKKPIHEGSERLSDPMYDEYYRLSIKARKSGMPQIASDGSVILSDERHVFPLDHGRFNKEQAFAAEWIYRLSRKADMEGNDTIDEFYDFGPPSDMWDDFEIANEIPEFADTSGFEEDRRTREFYNPKPKASKQPSEDSQDSEQSNMSVSEELSKQESDSPKSETVPK